VCSSDLEKEYPKVFKDWKKGLDYYDDDAQNSERSLALKHASILKDIFKKQYQITLILEDDVTLCDDFVNYCNLFISQLPDDWDPTTDRRLCVWEATQHLIKRLEASGEGAAAELLLQLKNISGHGDLAANCRALAYRLYNHCEKKKQAEEARAYNGLVIAWPELERLASASSTSSSAHRQTTLI
jgi:hypothetical protein